MNDLRNLDWRDIPALSRHLASQKVAESPRKEEVEALVLKAGMGQVDLHAGAIEAFLQLRGLKLDNEVGADQLKNVLGEGLLAASAIGAGKADALQQDLDKLAMPDAIKILKDLGAALGEGPQASQRGAGLKLPMFIQPVPSDSSLATLFGRSYACRALDHRVLELVSSVLSSMGLKASGSGNEITLSTSFRPGGEAPPPELVAAFKEGQAVGAVRQSTVNNAAMFAAAEIVAQATSKLRLARDNGLSVFEMIRTDVTVLRRGQDQPRFPGRHDEGVVVPQYVLSVGIDTKVGPKAATDDFTWAKKMAGPELWAQVTDLVRAALGTVNDPPRGNLGVIKVEEGRIVFEGQDAANCRLVAR